MCVCLCLCVCVCVYTYVCSCDILFYTISSRYYLSLYTHFTEARRIRDEILNTFVTSYKLKTLPNGAVVREWPLGYTVWVEDGTKDDGYSMLNNFEGRNPTREEVSDLIDVRIFE